MKNALPFTEEHFVTEDTPGNLRLGLDDKSNWIDSEMNSEEEITAELTSPPQFLYDFVEVNSLK